MFYWKLLVSPSSFTSLTTKGVYAVLITLEAPWGVVFLPHAKLPEKIVDTYLHSATRWHNQECALMPQVESILTWVVFCELLNIKQRMILPCGWHKLLYSCSCRTVALLNDVWLNSTVVWKHLAFLTLFCTDFSRGQGFIHQMLLKGRIVSAQGLDLYMCGTLYLGVWKP